MPAASPAAATTPNDQEAERFFGGIVSSLVSFAVPKIASSVLSMFRQRRRELGIPEQRDAASEDRDLQSILNALLPPLLAAVPSVAAALSGKQSPRGAEEEGQRFLPFLAAIIPAVMSAVPNIIGAFNQQRGADPSPPSITNPDVAERFLGPLLQTLVPQLVQSAPSILQSIFGGGRDLNTASTSSW
jgi:H+/gluconate symporter-like permease